MESESLPRRIREIRSYHTAIDNLRVQRLLGINVKSGKSTPGTIFSKSDRSKYSCERHKFFLDAPFELGNQCCSVMKKGSAKKYQRETGRMPITAQTASESRLRTQVWLKQGCNAFDNKRPMSVPMAFWLEQDVLSYIYQNKLPIASVYGEVVREEDIEGQMDWSDLGIFDLGRPTLKTTGCERTGCAFCGFGCHLEKRPNRFELIDRVSNPKLRDFCMRGGAFDEDGLWKPDNKGLGYWFVMKWINVHGGFDMYIPEYERYEAEYGNDLTRKYLEVNY